MTTRRKRKASLGWGEQLERDQHDRSDHRVRWSPLTERRCARPERRNRPASSSDNAVLVARRQGRGNSTLGPSPSRARIWRPSASRQDASRARANSARRAARRTVTSARARSADALKPGRSGKKVIGPGAAIGAGGISQARAWIVAPGTKPGSAVLIELSRRRRASPLASGRPRAAPSSAARVSTRSIRRRNRPLRPLQARSGTRSTSTRSTPGRRLR